MLSHDHRHHKDEFFNTCDLHSDSSMLLNPMHAWQSLRNAKRAYNATGWKESRLVQRGGILASQTLGLSNIDRQHGASGGSQIPDGDAWTYWTYSAGIASILLDRLSQNREGTEFGDRS